MFKAWTMAAALFLGATGADAFDFKSGELTLGYGKMSLNDLTDAKVDNLQIGARTSIGIGEDVTLSFGINHADSELFFDRLTVLSFLAQYQISDSFGLGAFFDQTRVADMYSNEKINHFGLQGSLYINNFELMGFVGRGQDEFDTTSKVFGINGQYAFGNGLDAGFFFIHESFDGDADKEYGLSLGYLVSGDSAAPIYFNASIGRSEGIFESANHIRASITIPLGGTPSRGTRQFHPHSAEINIVSNFGDISGVRVRCACST